MKAIRFKNQTIIPVDIPLPGLNPGDALIRVLTAGICATDIALLHGYAAFEGVPGHEFAGLVEKCPDRPDLVGKRVVADINLGCGFCDDERHCPNRRVLGIRTDDGAFAEYCVIPATNLYPVADTIKTRHAALAEPLAAALEITQQIHIRHRHRIAVIGDGCLGILCAMGVRQYSENVMLLGRHREKLAIARDQGIETVLVEKSKKPEEIAAATGTFDITIDAAGNAEGINACISLTRPEGIVVAKTTTGEKSTIDFSPVVVNELHILGSRCGNMALALDFLENRRIDVEPLITAAYPFSRIHEAFERAMEKQSLKVQIDFDHERRSTN